MIDTLFQINLYNTLPLRCNLNHNRTSYFPVGNVPVLEVIRMKSPLSPAALSVIITMNICYFSNHYAMNMCHLSNCTTTNICHFSKFYYHEYGLFLLLCIMLETLEVWSTSRSSTVFASRASATRASLNTLTPCDWSTPSHINFTLRFCVFFGMVLCLFGFVCCYLKDGVAYVVFLTRGYFF